MKNNLRLDDCINLCRDTQPQCSNLLVGSWSFSLLVKSSEDKEATLSNTFDQRLSSTFSTANTTIVLKNGTGSAEGLISTKHE